MNSFNLPALSWKAGPGPTHWGVFCSLLLRCHRSALRGSVVHWKEHQTPGAGSTAGDHPIKSHQEPVCGDKRTSLAQLTSGPLSGTTRRTFPCVPELSALCFPSQAHLLLPGPRCSSVLMLASSSCFFCRSYHLIFAKLHPSHCLVGLHQAPPLTFPTPASSFPLNTAFNTSSFCS